MKILFTMDDAGSDLLKQLLGFSDASLLITNLQSDIKAATDEIVELIGDPIYQSIVGIFEADSASADDAELLYRTQLAIALNAYRSYAPDNDLAHTNSGRKMRTEEHQKIPFEWQIDRSNRSLERKYYRAVDALLHYLDNNFTAWKNSDAHKATHALFVRTTKDFDTYFDIGRSRLLLIKLTPGLRLAETSEIRPRVGQALFEEMKAKLKASEDVDVELLEKIKEACVYSAIAWGLRRLSVQLFPEGILQFTSGDRLSTQGRIPAGDNSPAATAQRLDEDASNALQRIEELIAAKNQVTYTDKPPVEPYFNCDDTFITT